MVTEDPGRSKVVRRGFMELLAIWIHEAVKVTYL